MLDLNKTENLEKLKEEFSNIIDKRIDESKKNENIDSISNMPIAKMKALFESLSDKLYGTENGNKVIARYVGTVKSTNILDYYTLFEAISNGKSMDYVVSAIDFAKNINRKMLKESKSKLAEVIKEAVKVSDISNDEFERINEGVSKYALAIDSLITTPYTLSNLESYHNNLNTLSDLVNENASKKEANISESNIEDLDTVLSECATENEKRIALDIAKCIMSEGDKKDLFETYKKECIETINESLENSDADTETKSRLEKILESVSKKEYNVTTIYEDMSNFLDLKDTLS